MSVHFTDQVYVYIDTAEQGWTNVLCGGPHVICECALRARHSICMIFHHTIK